MDVSSLLLHEHILPSLFVKIHHGGYLAHNGKNKRIAAIHQQLKLPKPMAKVIIPFSPQMLQRTGEDYNKEFVVTIGRITMLLLLLKSSACPCA